MSYLFLPDLIQLLTDHKNISCVKISHDLASVLKLPVSELPTRNQDVEYLSLSINEQGCGLKMVQGFLSC